MCYTVTLQLAPDSSVVKRLAFPLFFYNLGAHLHFFAKLPTLTLFGLSLSGLSNKYHFRIENRFSSIADNEGRALVRACNWPEASALAQ